MRPVAVRILHPEPAPDAGPLERCGRLRPSGPRRPTRGGGSAPRAPTDVRDRRRPAGRIPFGRRLRELVRAERPAGLVVLGSGGDPAGDGGGLARARARRGAGEPVRARQQPLLGRRRRGRRGADGSRRPCRTAARQRPAALARPSAGYDGRATSGGAGASAIDLDSPLDLVLTGDGGGPGRRGADRSAAVRRARWPRRPARRRRPGAELLVAGRTSAATLAWLERRTASRTRALVEERGLRTSRARASGRRRSVPRARCSTATGRRRSGDASHASPTRRSSTRACCSPTASAPTRRLAVGRGPLRVRPPARGPDRRPVAPRADRRRARRADPDRCSAATPSSARASGSCSGAPTRGVDRTAEPGRSAATPPTGPRRCRRGRPALVARIRDEIARDGPMPFARFMELALYDPDGGYYRSPTAGPGRGGDFLTAPESHPIFGWPLARRSSTRSGTRSTGPTPFVVREHGAGTGALAVGILDGARPRRPGLAEAIRYQAIDVEPGASRRASPSGWPTAGFAGAAPRAPDGRPDRPASCSPTSSSTPCPVASRRGARRRPPRARSSASARRAASSRSRSSPSTPGARRAARRGGRRARAPASAPRSASRSTLGRRGGRRPGARARSSSSTTATPPPSCTTRSAARRHARAPTAATGSTPTRRARRPPGPDRPRRPHGRRARRGGRRPDAVGPTTQAEFLVGLGSTSCCARPVRPGDDARGLPRGRVGARADARPARRAGSGSWPSAAAGPPNHRCAPSAPARRSRAPAPPRTARDLPDRARPTGLGRCPYCRAPRPRARCTAVGHDLTGSGSRTCTRARRAPLPDAPSPATRPSAGHARIAAARAARPRSHC